MLLMCWLFTLAAQGTDVDTAVVRISELPGFDEFHGVVSNHQGVEGTYIVVHEEALPELIERLYLIARALTPIQRTQRLMREAEYAFVNRIIQQQWNAELLFLDRDATRKHFYGNLTLDPKKSLIIYTNRNLEQYIRYMKFRANSPTQGLTIVYQLDDGFLVFGDLP